jgi:hypothetical protein
MLFLFVAAGELYRLGIRNINCSAVKIWVRIVDRPKALDEQPAKIPAALNHCHDDLFAVLRLSAPK